MSSTARPYTIIYQPSAEKALRKLPREVQARIGAKVAALAEQPFPPGCQKLEAPVDLWRIRIGEYRVVYAVRTGELLILVVKVGHRSDVYRGLV